MKIYSISNSYPQTNFNGRYINKAKHGLIPLALASGLLMAHPAKANENMSNFDPVSEVSVPVSDTSVKFLKNMLIAAAIVYGALWGISAISDSDKNERNEH